MGVLRPACRISPQKCLLFAPHPSSGQERPVRVTLPKLRWPLRNVYHSSITSPRTTSSEVRLNVREHVTLLDTCHLTTGLGCKPTCLIFSLGSQNEGRSRCFFIQDMCWTQTPKDHKNGPISPASHSTQAMKANSSFSRRSRCLQPKASLPFLFHTHHVLLAHCS